MVVDMKEGSNRKIFEWLLLFFIVALSISVFVFRDKVTSLGSWGYGGLFLLCYLSNCTVFLPAPGLMVVISFAQAMSPIIVATLGAAGTTLGEMSGYAFGHAGQSVSVRFQKVVEWFSERIRNVNVLIFVLALLPLPLFDFAGIYAGGTKVKMWKFILACFIGKWLKMYIYAVAATQIFDYLMPFIQ